MILPAGKGVIIHFSVFIWETEFQRVQLSKSYTKVKSIPSMLDDKDHSLILLWTFHSPGIGVKLTHQLHIWFICLLMFHCSKIIFKLILLPKPALWKRKGLLCMDKTEKWKIQEQKKKKKKKRNRSGGRCVHTYSLNKYWVPILYLTLLQSKHTS